MPWEHRELLFDPLEMRRLFPERVVAWMETHPPAVGEGREGERRRRRLEVLAPLRPLPEPDDLPVVVAARMSLSFPLLISAVPLHALDVTRRRTREALEAVEAGRAPASPLQAEPCWFSDGGIASNFPVHFFDTPLPTRPTFAIDLDGFHPDHGRRPTRRRTSTSRRPTRAACSTGGTGSTLGRACRASSASRTELSAQCRTTWTRASAAARVPRPHRPRPFAARRGRDEPDDAPALIRSLTLRGRGAGRALVERFAETPGTKPGLSWDNHRWVRYRSALAALAELLEQLAAAWREDPEGERSYHELVERAEDAGPNGYRFTSEAQRQLALALTELLAEAGELAERGPGSVARGAPRPEPVARIVPGA